MNYLPEDQQPSIFFLQQDPRQSILTIFNWTEKTRTHKFQLSDLNLPENHNYSISDVFEQSRRYRAQANSLLINQPAHSVRMLKIIDTSIAPQVPEVKSQHPSTSRAGEAVEFTAQISNPDAAVLSVQWDCGDGVKLQGKRIAHAYTHAGNYKVTLTAAGLDGTAGTDSFVFPVTGSIPTKFVPAEIQRYNGK